MTTTWYSWSVAQLCRQLHRSFATGTLASVKVFQARVIPYDKAIYNQTTDDNSSALVLGDQARPCVLSVDFFDSPDNINEFLESIQVFTARNVRIFLCLISHAPGFQKDERRIAFVPKEAALSLLQNADESAKLLLDAANGKPSLPPQIASPEHLTSLVSDANTTAIAIQMAHPQPLEALLHRISSSGGAAATDLSGAVSRTLTTRSLPGEGCAVAELVHRSAQSDGSAAEATPVAPLTPLQAELMRAAETGEWETLRRLLGVETSQWALEGGVPSEGTSSAPPAVASPADVNCHDPRHGGTPLHLLCGGAAGDDPPAPAAIRWLISRGADVNAPAANGSTPLHWAAGKGYLVTLIRFTLTARVQYVRCGQ